MSFPWANEYKPTHPVMVWMDEKLPLPRLVYGAVGGGYEVPRNLNYAYTFGGSGTADEHIFANGTPWPITATKTEPSSANMLTIRGADNGNGSSEPPWITCFVPAGTVGGWIEIDPVYAIHPNAGTGATASRVPKPGSKLWHTYNSFNGTFVGSYRNGAGETFWGRRCRMVDNANGAAENAPAQDYAHGVPNFGGQCVYLTAGNPDTNATLLKRLFLLLATTSILGGGVSILLLGESMTGTRNYGFCAHLPRRKIQWP